jgi:hypothetical protein
VRARCWVAVADLNHIAHMRDGTGRFRSALSWRAPSKGKGDARRDYKGFNGPFSARTLRKHLKSLKATSPLGSANHLLMV